MHTSSVIIYTLPTAGNSCSHLFLLCAFTKAIDPKFLKHTQEKLHSCLSLQLPVLYVYFAVSVTFFVCD
jgi:hypothetical protein